MNTIDFHYTRISEQNLNDFQQLYESSYENSISIDAIKTKFDTKKFGAQWIGYLAYDNHLAIAFYGVYPCRAIYNNTEILVAQSGDTMTHPDYRGKGLFVELAKRTYGLAREEGIHIVFGFPNANSYPGFKRKLDWVHFDDIVSYVLPVKTLSWYRINKHFKLPNRWQGTWASRIAKRLKKGSPFPSSCIDKDTMAIVHNSDFFDYKKYGGSELIDVAGVSVWVKFSHEFLWIGDIEKIEMAQLDKVIVGLKRIAALSFIPHLRFQGSTDTFLARYFQEKGKKLDSTHPIAGLNLLNQYPMENMKFTLCDNDTF